VAAIVLAGGRSSRMGQDKALLPFGGTTLLNRICCRLLEDSWDVIVVAESESHFRDAGLAEGVQIVGDLYPGMGPMGGIVTGLRAAGEGIHAVVGCDMPRVSNDLLRLLLDGAHGHDAAVPELGSRLEPLCAAYDAGCVGRLEPEIRAGRLSLQHALRTLNINIVPESSIRSIDPDLVSFTNINTPEEYRDAVGPKGFPTMLAQRAMNAPDV